MKKLLSLVLFLLCTLTLASSYAKANEQSLDQIVAVVNDDVITRSELNLAVKTAKLQLSQEQTAAMNEKVLQKQMLDQIINRKLQLQLAEQAGIKVTDNEVNTTIGKIAQQNNVSVNALYRQLNKEGMSTEHYRQEMHDQIVLRRLQQQEVVNRLSISPQEVDTFLNSKAWQNNESKEYKINDILIPLSEAPSSDEITAAKKRAQVVITKLNQGKKLREIVQSETDLKQILQTNDLGWRKLPEIPSAFADVITHMKPKEIAGPIQAPNGLHIIRLAAMRSLGAKQAPPDRKKVEELLLERKFEEAAQTWMSRVRNQAYIVNKLNA